MITLDGSLGEGGGQILRSSLALSLITQQPFRIERIRANREKPGLQRQHLTCVLAAAEIGGATVDGAELNSTALTFRPGPVKSGEYRFEMPTAGSTTLVLQTVLPPLMLAGEPSMVHLEGGTHNIHAPPFDYLERVFLPLIGRMGPRVVAELEAYGFYPAGGGKFSATIEPVSKLQPIELIERGRIVGRLATASVIGLPPTIAGREVDVVQKELGWTLAELAVHEDAPRISPGNVLTLEVESEALIEMVVGIGQRGVKAEQVAREACAEMKRYLDTPAPVGPYLADQLLLPMSLAGSGRYVTGPLTLHTKTNIDVIRRFLPVRIDTHDRPDGTVEVIIAS